ncbi:hypothetical protein E1287_21095 [Actinomadura sp. KC06]|uniref:hypothetical protein n=1 Tax=Actinomadura sp. KC06 TaxID=2530369 RepID=UPI001053C7AA|nr:hypothetical protein [Actinomadura sp. KC06]TDD32901.1 hypothetical protein E1287_21095 [Actinomadura sp. KC06]
MTSAAEVCLETVSEAASAFSAGGSTARSRVVLQGVPAVLSYRLEAEAGRRRAARIGAITSPDVLRLLLGLPTGVPVPLAALTGPERCVLQSAPGGAVQVKDRFVIRLAEPPVEVGLAVVTAATWRQGLERAGRFAPFCSRAMVLPRMPRDIDVLRMEADFYGIGVIIAGASAQTPELIVPATGFRRNRFTAAGWLFLEEAYRQVVRAS